MYINILVIGGGITAVHFFVGTESAVYDVYPLKNDKEFANVLQDNTKRCKALFKSVRDRMQVPIYRT